MSNPETYDHTLDAPPTPAVAAPVMPLPDEAYYRRAPQRGRNAGLGIALVVVGLALLAFQMLGRGFPLGSGSYTLVDKQVRGSALELAVEASNVEVHAWDGNEIKIVAVQRGGSQGDYEVNVSQRGDTVSVTENRRSSFCFFCSNNITYRIDVPHSGQANIKTSSGEITVDGLSGPVTLTTFSGNVRGDELKGGLTVGTTSGNVELNGIAGALKVDTISGNVELTDGQVGGAAISSTSGNVELDGASGQLQINTVSGNVTVNDARTSQLNISTSDGNVEFQGDLGAGASQVSTLSGNVQLELPEQSSFKLDASSASGEVSSDFQLAQAESGRNSLKGVAGSGAASLTLNTTSGEITVEAR